jgi:ribosomal protein S27E
MARYLDLKCKECGEDVEVYCDGDNAMMCPECLSIDCFEERGEDETKYQRIREDIAKRKAMAKQA